MRTRRFVRSNADIEKARNDLREWSQKQIDAIDNEIDSARAKAASATPALKADFAQAMRAVEAKRARVRKQLATLDSQAANGLSEFEAKVHTQVDELKTSVDQMRQAL